MRAGFKQRETNMTLCPVALAVGCRKCPVFNICPAKGIIGDYKKEPTDQAASDKTGKPPETGKK